MQQQHTRPLVCAFLAALHVACGGTDGGVATKAGFVNGKAVDFAGNPLVDTEIVILGTTLAGGEDVSFYPRTAADGTYSMEVPDGNYSVSARHGITFDGKRYTLDLQPGDGKRGKSYPSKAGITQNFTLQVKGLRPDGETAPKEGYSYYGGQSDFTIGDVYSESFQTNHFATEFPNGFTARVTLTPQGTLLDGSTGAPVVVEKLVTSMYEATFKQIDIPLGKYTVTGVAVKPSGETRTLKFTAVGPYATVAVNPPAESATFVFEPDTSGIRSNGVKMIYGAPYPAP